MRGLSNTDIESPPILIVIKIYLSDLVAQGSVIIHFKETYTDINQKKILKKQSTSRNQIYVEKNVVIYYKC